MPPTGNPPAQVPRLRFVPLFLALLLGRALKQWKRRPLCPAPLAHRLGVSVIIPERATPDLLERSLENALVACALIDEPSEIIVSVNGAPLDNYAAHQLRFPAVRWLHRSEERRV